MSTDAESLTAPLHPTVLDALRNTPAAPLIGQPGAQVLATIGLPGVPQPIALAPLPGLPPLPALDMTALLKPVTDLFGGFGTGALGAAGAVNPQSLLQGVLQGVGTAVQLGQQGLQLLQSMQGQGATAATASGVAALGDSASVSDQATQVHASLGAAATTVATGSAQMSAVAARLVATEAMLAPLAVTPGGQAALIAAATEAAAEAAAITAATKAQLVGHSAVMTQAGNPVSVSGGTVSTAGSSSQSELTQLISGFQQVMQVAQPLVSTALTALPAAAKATAEPVSANTDSMTTGAISAIVPGGIAALGAIPSAAGVQAMSARAALGAWQAETVGAAAASPAGTTPAMVEEPLPPLIPSGGALAGVRAGVATSAPAAGVTARHSDELDEDSEEQTPAPVIGAVTVTETPPDTAFSL
ncbi:hypothetical protein [Nocardia macrotermitis]|uniref:Uncharacterized protein n=1 Tax=Nocardia macrotermitis TaxID=2585198 RepID=A0A7K0DC72_9NOCA|nr:hypothetical protein [Nocardia macrotermitis]MQY22484.1 hypothetical protein [Nocardia macrotermitis]